jgi:hypothetical protein
MVMKKAKETTHGGKESKSGRSLLGERRKGRSWWRKKQKRLGHVMGERLRGRSR